MIEGLEKALELIRDEIEVAKKYGQPLMVLGMNQLENIVRKELRAEELKQQ